MIGLDRTWNMFLPYKIRTEKHECIGGSRDITTRQTFSRWCTATPGWNWYRLRWREKGWRRRQRLNRIVTIFWLDKRPWSYIGRKHDWFLGWARETDTIHSRFGWVQAYRGLSLSSGKVRMRLTSEHYGRTPSTIDRMSRKTGSGHDDWKACSREEIDIYIWGRF